MTQRKRSAQPTLSNLVALPISELQLRVTTLERETHELKGRMGLLAEDVHSLKTVVKQMDERTIRGERLMLDMQLDQRKLTKLVERIASALHVDKEPTP